MADVIILREIVERLPEYDARGALVCVPDEHEDDIDGDTPMVVTYSDDDDEDSGVVPPEGTRYFLEAPTMTEVVASYERELKTTLSTNLKVKAIVFFAEHDGYFVPRSRILED